MSVLVESGLRRRRRGNADQERSRYNQPSGAISDGREAAVDIQLDTIHEARIV
jgi:hypothetical protein